MMASRQATSQEQMVEATAAMAEPAKLQVLLDETGYLLLRDVLDRALVRQVRDDIIAILHERHILEGESPVGAPPSGTSSNSAWRLGEFKEQYNQHGILERHGHLTPRQSAKPAAQRIAEAAQSKPRRCPSNRRRYNHSLNKPSSGSYHIRSLKGVAHRALCPHPAHPALRRAPSVE